MTFFFTNTKASKQTFRDGSLSVHRAALQEIVMEVLQLKSNAYSRSRGKNKELVYILIYTEIKVSALREPRKEVHGNMKA